MKSGDVLIINTLLCHAPLNNGGLGDRWVFYPYFGPLMPSVPSMSMKVKASILPNSPYEVSKHFSSYFVLFD
jgi:hypothetical protein